MMEKNNSASRMERRKQNKKPPKRFRKFLTYTAVTFLVLFLVIVVGGGITVFSMIKNAPELNAQNLKYASSSTVYDMNSKKVISINGKEKRDYASIKDIPPRVRNAFIATEDVRFYKHSGIDPKRVAGAIMSNITHGFGSEGASTITQQVIKNSFLSPEKTVTRKIQEAYLALKLEREYSKDQILEFYLNKIYFGHGAYGVKTAAKVYFDKSLDQLTTSEIALLAGLPQRPNGYDPVKRPDLAKDRRNVVLSLMEKNGYISEQEKEKAQSVPIEKMVVKQKEETGPRYEAFLQQVIDDAEKEGISEKDLFEGGLKIYTTLDPDAQSQAEKILSTDDYVVYPDKQFQAGVVLLDTKTGEIRAIGGNRLSEKEQVSRGFNYATDTQRQPGSTIKPVLDYGPAIEYLKWSTNTPIKDEPLEINGKQVQNWDKSYHGTLTMREALVQSYNIPAIKAYQAVGEDNAKKFANNLGLGLDKIYPSYAIGGFETGVSPLKMAGAFSAFGNQGVYNQPTTLRKIEYPNGKVREIKHKPKKAMSDYTAYMVTDMLKSVVSRGTGRMAQIPGLDVAGKTGTTNLPQGVYGNGSSDSWFVGYTTRYTAAVWTGYDKTGSNMYVRKDDQVIAKLIFKQLMSHASQGKMTADFEKPGSVVARGSELYVQGTSVPALAQPKYAKSDEDTSKSDQTEEAKKEEDATKEKDKKEEEKKTDQEKPKDDGTTTTTPDTPATPPKDDQGGSDQGGNGDNGQGASNQDGGNNQDDGTNQDGGTDQGGDNGQDGGQQDKPDTPVTPPKDDNKPDKPAKPEKPTEPTTPPKKDTIQSNSVSSNRSKAQSDTSN
ncbi:transglycosylase domain-containing protein [Fictibacillus enclensis]|nr:PBP1A family penicillin-binding protein [Fictibacillus enclensis]